jgi:uncharacterized protein YdaU (DUF1376 family)
MKYPFMPLFLGDLFADTLHLSTLEFGAYTRLFCHAWKHNAKIVTKDAQKVTGVGNRHWAKVRAKIAPFFEPQDGLLGDTLEVVHPRVAKELAKAGEISNKRKDAAEQMHAKRRANASVLHMHPHAHAHIESFLGKQEEAPSMQMHGTDRNKGVDCRPGSLELQLARKQHLGISPDKGMDYRAPPAKKSDNVLAPLAARKKDGQ